ncbi:MAG: hypothetical protein JO235_07525 [Chroococcidiopsidaceae cyanobacterium CP_BM_RX_35]|nr:hypothetical protein [Chroococcidiopsidaceae cyanobacterium CP_BM_RX_35]
MLNKNFLFVCLSVLALMSRVGKADAATLALSVQATDTAIRVPGPPISAEEPTAIRVPGPPISAEEPTGPTIARGPAFSEEPEPVPEPSEVLGTVAFVAVLGTNFLLRHKLDFIHLSSIAK